MRTGVSAKVFRVIKVGVVVFFVSASSAHAANAEEQVKSLAVAIITVMGIGWLWRRSFKASDVYEVWYGTNRLNKIANTFDNNFGTGIHYGRCWVAIPKGHVFGSVGSSLLRRWLQRLTSGTDDRLTVIKIEPLSPTEFEEGVSRKLAKFEPNERTVLIFIHGYNVKFSEAAIRAGQIGFDLNVPGLMALYSWPSKAELSAYLSDADSAAASEMFIVDFIALIARAAGNAKINIIAHSMGNLCLLRALTAGLASRRLDGITFGQIFLAAPDIDVNLFRQLATIYPLCSERTTLYVSAVDRALSTSRWIHTNQRTGYSPPVTVIRGIDTVETTHIDIGLLGHGYYAEAAPVLYDMAMLLRSNLPPDKRPGLFSSKVTDGEYWVIRPQVR